MNFTHRARGRAIRGHSRLLWLCLVLSLVLASCTGASPTQSTWRGAWVRGKDLSTPEQIDQILQRAEAGGFNAIFVNVYLDGQAMYDSALAEKYHKIDPGFDPLAYLVPEAHRRGIEVHAWFVVGRINKTDSPILLAHPDWALMGPDGDTTPWLNFTRPDVRQFISDLMMETVERYGVDGIHFDYTRYPGPEWGFDPYSIQSFMDKYGLDLNQLRYADLPAYGRFEGNPLAMPDTAKVLASFANGYPAVALNQYGKGEVLLLNWKASERNVAFGSEVMRRGLQRLLDPGGQVVLLRSETNAGQYGYDDFDSAQSWLRYLGWDPAAVSEAEIASLPPESVLVVPNVYLISQVTAASLADFVRQGGGVIFIDGPTKSIQIEDIRAITGMRSSGRYFNADMVMTAAGKDPLIPTSQRSIDLQSYRNWDAKWREFRQQGINDLIREIHDRVKAKHPNVTVSITITSDQVEANARYLEDWQTWLKDGYVDLLVPRGYVDNAAELNPILNSWRPIIRQYVPRIALGLITYANQGGSPVVKSPAQLLTEIGMIHKAGSNGYMIYDLGSMSDEQLSAIKLNSPK